MPGKDGGGCTVIVGWQNIWIVNAKGANVDMAKKVMLELGLGRGNGRLCRERSAIFRLARMLPTMPLSRL